MRRKSYLLIFPFLLLLTGCADISGKHPVISQTTVTNIQTQQYTFSIVQSKGSSAQINDKISYTGAFELIVKNDKGIETSHKSLNEYFSYLLETIPQYLDGKQREFIKDLMPWSSTLPDRCRSNKK